MKVYEILSFNRELLKRLHIAGIKPDDYVYVELYTDFKQLMATGQKVTYTVACLAQKYQVSERKVYSLIRKFDQDVNCCKIGAVE